MAVDSFQCYIANSRGRWDQSCVLRIGVVVNRWKVTASLGRGGFAEVYRVINSRDGRVGALKLLVSSAENAKERFCRELSFLRDHQVKYFPHLLDEGEQEGRLFYVMEELEQFEMPHKDPEVTRLLTFVCDAIAILHGEGYIHRDLKPDNIMRRKDGSYVLIDFGLVRKILGAEGFNVGVKQVSICDGSKVAVGTPGLGAPEQFIDGDSSFASDYFSIGRLANCCFKENMPKHWQKFVDRATVYEPKRRFGTIQEVREAVLDASSIKPRLLKSVFILEIIQFVIIFGMCAFVFHTQPSANLKPLWFLLIYLLPIFLIPFRNNISRVLNVIVNGFSVFLLVNSMVFMLVGHAPMLTVCGAFLSVVLVFGTSIAAFILLLLPSVVRWFKA